MVQKQGAEKGALQHTMKDPPKQTAVVNCRARGGGGATPRFWGATPPPTNCWPEGGVLGGAMGGGGLEGFCPGGGGSPGGLVGGGGSRWGNWGGTCPQGQAPLPPLPLTIPSP